MSDLQAIERWMQTEIAPDAQVMDRDPSILFQAFQKLGDRNLLALRLPQEAGGQGWDEAASSQFQILIASYSGALSFLATQHQSALRMLHVSPNADLKSELISDLIHGRRGLGVGFSHLRRSGTPMMIAIPDSSGYLLSGTVPWVTGLGCFDGFICGARLPNHDILMAWVPLDVQCCCAQYQISDPLALTAMASTQTVEVYLKQWRITDSQVIAVHDRNWLRKKDRANALHHGFYALGSARAALNLMNAVVTPQKTAVIDAIASFQTQYQQTHARMLDLLPQREEDPNACLAAKANAIHLAGRCAQAAIAWVGGSANHANHPAQRIYREVLAFTVFGQTPAAKHATLAALSSFSRS